MITILFENENYVICLKPNNIDSEENGLVATLKEQLNCPIFCVHRLDKIVGGVMIYAKTNQMASKLSKQIQEKTFKKSYLCIVENQLEKKEDTLIDLLYHDKNKNKTYVCKKERKNVKKAILHYDELASFDNYSLLKVQLETGRTHQIRVQFASRKHPLIGDRKYGSKINNPLCLWSYEVSFIDQDKRMSFSFLPDITNYWSLFEKELTNIKND